MTAPSPFAGFWYVGFEGADHIHDCGQVSCLHLATGADSPWGDYRGMARLGLRSERGLAIDRAGRPGSPGPRHRRSRESRAPAMQQPLKSCFHYGMRDGPDILSADFVPHSADYAHALVAYPALFHGNGRASLYTPINGTLLRCWAGCETGLMHPHLGDRMQDGYPLISMRGKAARWRSVRAAIPTNTAGRGCSTSARRSRLRVSGAFRSRWSACIRRATGPTGNVPIAGIAAGCGMCARTACGAVSFPITRRRFALRNTTGDVRIGRRPQPPGAL